MRPVSSWPRRVGGITRTQAAVAAILLIALAARLVYVLHTMKYVPIADAKSYNALARGLALGHGWSTGTSAYRPPAYPFFLAVIYKLVGVPPGHYMPVGKLYGDWAAARAAEAFEATITVALIGWLAHQLAGRRVALVALVISAASLSLIVVGVSIMSESLLVPLELAAVNCALRARASGARVRWVVLAGLFAGLAALTRGNGIVIAIGLAFVVWTVRPRRSLRSLARPALLLAVAALTIMPWTIRNAIAQHAFIPVTTELGATIAGTYNDYAARHHYLWADGAQNSNYASLRNNHKLVEHVRASRLVSAVEVWISHHPSSVPLAMFWNTVRVLDLSDRNISRLTAHTDVGSTPGVADLTVYTFWIVGALAVVAVLMGAARAVPRSLWIVPFLIWLGEAPITTGTPRFRAALDPWFILLAAFGIVALARRGSEALARRQVRAPSRALSRAA